MSNYETMVLIAPTIGPEAVERLIKAHEEVITTNGGTIAKVNKWGRKSLAYEIKKFKEGIYVIYEYEAPGDLIKEFERRLRINDSILRFITVKTDLKARLESKGAAIAQVKSEKSKRRSNRASSNSNRDDRSHGGNRDDRNNRDDRSGSNRDGRSSSAPAASSNRDERPAPAPVVASTQDEKPVSAPAAGSTQDETPVSAPVAASNQDEKASSAPVASSNQDER